MSAPWLRQTRQDMSLAVKAYALIAPLACEYIAYACEACCAR